MGFDTEWTTFPTCPHCGKTDQDWWDGLDPNKGDGDSWEVDCGFCGEKYTTTMSISTNFSTKPYNNGVEQTPSNLAQK